MKQGGARRDRGEPSGARRAGTERGGTSAVAVAKYVRGRVSLHSFPRWTRASGFAGETPLLSHLTPPPPSMSRLEAVMCRRPAQPKAREAERREERDEDGEEKEKEEGKEG
ncbi:hypothetical protein E2C01_052777 [Portunus trituberculatus]|uniref:Uncharacterized protein n=1 Tax=Portunus trituberculatus TaxID=210409 RepID=A0A5B7GNE4_PORTR|nr:hypothetical protein [Portunus trituberculatus]